MGGVGGIHLITLVRTGVGKFHIADFDVYEPANINRQFGARVPDFGRPKLEVMKEQAVSINPYLEFSLFEEGINESNIDSFLDGVDVVLDGLDFFEFEIRRLLFKKAAEKGIHVITAGPMGFSSAMLIFSPHGMGFDEYFNIREDMEEKDKYLSFALGLSPRPTHIKYMDFKKVDLDSKAGPSLNAACQICSGMAATETLRIILKRRGLRPVPCFAQFDPYLMKLKKGRLVFGNKNPVQRVKMQIVKYLLEKNRTGLMEKASDRPEFKLGPNMKTIPLEVVEYLVRAGIQAPSGDNAQPWKFNFDTEHIDLFLDREKDPSFFNVNQIASLISCGAVLENIRIAATAFSITADIDIMPFNAGENPVAKVSFKSAEPIIEKPDPLHDFIWKRHTNRKMFKRTSVSAAVINEMKSSISFIPGAKLRIVTDRAEMKKVARLIYQIDRIRTEFRPLHEHLIHMIRFTHKEALEKRDGLPLKNLEAGLAGEYFLKLTRHWPMMNMANKLGLGRMVALHSSQGIMNSSGVALLTVDGMDQINFIQGGQALERVWLTLSLLGFSMQPMTAVTLFYLRWYMNGKSQFDARHQKVMEKLEHEYQKIFNCSNFASVGQIMVFRFGKSDAISCRTLRKEPIDLN
jgi:molybdopterin/thiamine biosynthesis adenylyltransferase